MVYSLILFFVPSLSSYVPQLFVCLLYLLCICLVHHSESFNSHFPVYFVSPGAGSLSIGTRKVLHSLQTLNCYKHLYFNFKMTHFHGTYPVPHLLTVRNP
ncbi:hypothetical protein BKA70DRAFT_1263580 [Coprinopsis sp. MPI-PUGE-AT-0042]|nr:hypothetical protein BKA70DRAFT_1263580 [Coprinopsis sp. MPI-PUGE-AT-0042]